jgi:hypothetical protein
MIAAELGFQWFIEDQRSNANLLATTCRVLLVDRPYNQGALHPGVERVIGLRGAAQRIDAG